MKERPRKRAERIQRLLQRRNDISLDKSYKLRSHLSFLAHINILRVYVLINYIQFIKNRTRSMSRVFVKRNIVTYKSEIYMYIHTHTATHTHVHTYSQLHNIQKTLAYVHTQTRGVNLHVSHLARFIRTRDALRYSLVGEQKKNTRKSDVRLRCREAIAIQFIDISRALR